MEFQEKLQGMFHVKHPLQLSVRVTALRVSRRDARIYLIALHSQTQSLTASQVRPTFAGTTSRGEAYGCFT